MENFLEMNAVGFLETLVRVSLALAFGFLLGFEREQKNKPIDFRAYMIVAVTTCILAIMGQELCIVYENAGSVVSLDLGKIISGVVTGIGFLGAGAIIKVEGRQIVGTATGASVWAAGGIGLCLGFGSYALALIGFAAVGCVLFLGGLMHSSDKEDLEGES